MEKTETLPMIEFVEAVWKPCDKQEYLRIFEEERKRIGLGNKDISLLVLEEGSFSDEIGSAGGNRTDGYSITMNPDNPEARLYGLTPKEIIKHELAHIKNGDCDRKLPRIIKTIYKYMIAEPRAIFYQLFG